MMKLNDDGTYLRPDHISREVCINRRSITETDGPVFFVSKKGLMVVSGKSVSCVSERMDGKAFDTSLLDGLGAGIGAQDAPTAPWAAIITACQDGGRSFLDYIGDAECMMAYDYIDRRLLIINARTETVTQVVGGESVTTVQRVYNYCYSYSIADGTLSKTVLPAQMTNVVNNYPDYLLQAGNTLYTLYGKQREEEVGSRQTAFLLTRPMKLAGPVGKSSVRELMNVGMWDEGTAQSPLSCVKTKLYLSDNLKDWYEATSRFGAAAKYFRLALFIKMLPTERLSGTIVCTQERRTDNMI